MTPIRLVSLCLLAAVFLFVGAPLPPPAGAASVTDHLQCYQMKDGLNLAGVVDLDAPDLGLAAGCKISKAKLYCTPTSAVVVSADDKGTKSPISPLPFVGAPRPGDQICYKVKCPNPVPPIADQTATDRFGSRTLTKLKSSLMCTPAVRGTSYCGNGALDAGEECDGASLGGATCSDRGYQSGTLACSPWCTFDTAACSSSCGGTGCTGGTVACGGACTNLTFDPSNCGACGAACPGATNASPACGGGRCGLVCNALYEDCNDSWADGCETSTGSDPNNCGGCGTSVRRCRMRARPSATPGRARRGRATRATWIATGWGRTAARPSPSGTTKTAARAG